MLRREDSNKLLKHVKFILFATGLSLLNPINVKAQEITPQEVIEENTENGDTQEEANQNLEKENNGRSKGLLIIGTFIMTCPIVMMGLATLLTLSESREIYTNSLEKDEKSEKIKTIKLKDLKNK